MKNNRHFHLAGWFGAKDVPPEPFPPGNQDITEEDHPSATDPYDVAWGVKFYPPPDCPTSAPAPGCGRSTILEQAQSKAL
jgi:hypothetical protein